MGGRGSGRQAGLVIMVDKCHEYYSIDLAWLRRKKLFNVERWSSLTWSRAGRETGSIRIECHANGVRLIYRHRRHGEDWQDVNELVPLVETPTRFGGTRQWFLCPSCKARCRIWRCPVPMPSMPAAQVRYAVRTRVRPRRNSGVQDPRAA